MKRKLDPNKIYNFIGRAVVYTSGWALSVVFFYWAFLQRINLLGGGRKWKQQDQEEQIKRK